MNSNTATRAGYPGIRKRPGSPHLYMRVWGPRKGGSWGEIEVSTGTADWNTARKRRVKELGRIDGHRRGAEVYAREDRGLTVSRLADTLERVYAREGKKSLRTSIAHLRPIRKHLGGYRAHSLSLAVLEKYQDTRRGEGRSPACVDREIELLRRCYTLARERKEIHVIPAFPGRLLRPGDNTKTDFWSAADFAAVVKELPTECQRDFSVWGYITGMRLSEIAALSWTAFDKETRIVRLPGKDSKTGTPRQLPLEGFPILAEIIERRHAARVLGGRNLIFCGTRGESIGTGIYNTMRRAMDRAGVREMGEEGKGGLTFHGLRRTAVRNFVAAGVDRDVIRMIVGHAADAMLARYNIVSTANMIDAGKRLGIYLKFPAVKKNTGKNTGKTGVSR